MKKLTLSILAVAELIAAPALAAEMATSAVTPIYDWSGCYFGVEGGGNWGRSNQVARSGVDSGQPITGDYDLAGALLGGTVGCNYQVRYFAVAIENDYSWTNKSGSHDDIPPFNKAAVSSTKEKWLDTLRGRAGLAWDRLFFYGTGGIAWAGTDVTVLNQTTLFSVTDSQTRTGWVAGAGGEWAAGTGAGGTLSFKIEYLHMDLGTGRYIQPPVVGPAGGIVATRDVKLTDDIVRAGINWKFNWGSARAGAGY